MQQKQSQNIRPLLAGGLAPPQRIRARPILTSAPQFWLLEDLRLFSKQRRPKQPKEIPNLTAQSNVKLNQWYYAELHSEINNINEYIDVIQTKLQHYIQVLPS